MSREIDWHRRARCKEPWVDPEWFFPEHTSPTDVLAICAACPVRRQCLDFALNNPLGQYGIWGGTTAYERRRMRASVRDDMTKRIVTL